MELGTVIISTYPPRSCGLATYAADVVQGLQAVGAPCAVVAMAEHHALPASAPEVWRNLRYDDRTAYAAIAREINASGFGTVAIQHEFGLFGGDDGEWLLDFYAASEKPIVTTLHTVLPAPSDNQRRIIREIAASSKRIIVLSDVSRRLLAENYAVGDNVVVVPHGVPDVPFTNTAEAKVRFGYGFAGRPVISTFGLMSRGKGIEFAIDAVRDVKRAIPDVLYVVAGRTHPKVLEQEGESYRSELRAKVRNYGLDDNFLFIDEFLTLRDLLGLLAATDVYFTPYKNREQVVSGTLAYAMGAGKAILSTPYFYAEELLGESRGFLCDFGDSKAMGRCLEQLLSDDLLRLRVERRAYAYGRHMTWPQVSRAFAEIYAEAQADPARPTPRLTGVATPNFPMASNA